MFRRLFLASLMLSCFPFFSLRSDEILLPICEETLDCEEAHPLATWVSYTYFRLHDGRKRDSGESKGQSMTFGVSYGLSPCWSTDLYGIYESSKTESPLVTVEATFQRTLTRAEGWGAGGQINYSFPCNFTGYLNFAYVFVWQHFNTKDLTGEFEDLRSKTSGYRWQAALGLNALYPCENVTFSWDINYLYVSSSLGGFVDPLGQELTNQSSRLGSLNATGILFLFPNWTLTPVFNAALGCDLNRHNDFPTFFSRANPPPPPTKQTFPLRNRFEWNFGGGLLLKKKWVTLSIVYQHKGRPGPIRTHLFTGYGSIAF